jgi:hypothetical protein
MDSQFVGPFVDMSSAPPLDIVSLANQYKWSGAVMSHITADSNGNPVWGETDYLPVLAPICSSASLQSDCSQASKVAGNLTSFINKLSYKTIISFGGGIATSNSLAQYAQAAVKKGSTQNQAVNDLVTKIESVIKMYNNIYGLDFAIQGDAQGDGSALYWALALKCIKTKYPKLRISYSISAEITLVTLKTQVFFPDIFLPDVFNLFVCNFTSQITSIGNAAVAAIEAIYHELLPLYPPGSFSYANLGFTPMAGKDNTNVLNNVMTDMSIMCQFAKKNGVGMLSIIDAQADLPCNLSDRYNNMTWCKGSNTTYSGYSAGSYVGAFGNCKPTS